MNFRKTLITLFAAATIPAAATTPAGFLGGMEVELTPEVAQRLVHYYDFSGSFPDSARMLLSASTVFPTYSNSELRQLFFRTYLSLPENYQSLSLEQKQLLHQRYSQRLAQVGASSSRPSGLITNSVPGLILPNGTFRPTEDSSEYQRARYGWENQLTDEERLGMIEPNRLPRLSRAIHWNLVGNYVGGKPQPQLWPQVPENGTSAMYRTLRRLDASTDMDAIEFRHTEPVDNSEDLWSDIETFLRHAGVYHSFSSDRIDDLVFARRNSSLHYHLSRTEPFSAEFVGRLNILFLLQDIQAGYNGNFDSTARFIYRSEATARGLLRWIASNRIEIRSHRGNLKAQFDWIMQLIAKPEAIAIAELNQMIRANFSEEALNKVMQGVYQTVPATSIDDDNYRDDSTDAARAIVFVAMEQFPERANEIRRRVPHADLMVNYFINNEFKSEAPLPSGSLSCSGQFRD